MFHPPAIVFTTIDPIDPIRYSDVDVRTTAGSYAHKNATVIVTDRFITVSSPTVDSIYNAENVIRVWAAK